MTTHTDQDGTFFGYAAAWTAAVLTGIVFGAVMVVVGDAGYNAAAFYAVVVAIPLGFVLAKFVASDAPRRKMGTAPTVEGTASSAYPPTRQASAADTAREYAPGLTSSLENAGTSIRDGAQDVADKARGMAHGASDAITAGAQKTSDAVEKTSETVADGATKAADAVERASETVTAGAHRAADSIEDGLRPEDTATEPTPVRPARLPAPREGGPDDLKKIKGVGPKLEELLHSMGFFHYDQVAAWGPAEVAWVDQNLDGFNGRATRDEWVEQAAVLAAGGETEFSQRVEKGDVYD